MGFEVWVGRHRGGLRNRAALFPFPFMQGDGVETVLALSSVVESVTVTLVNRVCPGT